MSSPRPEPTEILGLEQLPVARRDPPDPLRRILILDGLFLFGLLGVAALLTPTGWLAFTDTIGAILSLAAAGCYWMSRDF